VPASVGARVDDPAAGTRTGFAAGEGPSGPEPSRQFEPNWRGITRFRKGKSVLASVGAGQPARDHPVPQREVGARFGGRRPTGAESPGSARVRTPRFGGCESWRHHREIHHEALAAWGGPLGARARLPVQADPVGGHSVSRWEVGARFGECRPTSVGSFGLVVGKSVLASVSAGQPA
jgi:hypothetical protein